MSIKTEILGTFTARKGTEMVSFFAKRDDGRNWAAPRRMVEKGIEGDVVPGLPVRIEVTDDRITRVQQMGDLRARADATRAGKSTLQSASQKTAGRPSDPVLPYVFVPFSVEHAVTDTPVWHDGSSGGDLLSGEILCELEALTPLLPGNTRYKKGQADSEQLKQWEFGDLPDDKSISEPMRLPDGRVVIAGSALKGMIRQSLGALTSAPMARVGERHFSDRPNPHRKREGAREGYVSTQKFNDPLRACLTPIADETTAIKPERLTGARLLFGYVSNDPTTPIGEGLYKRLAGRISVNQAVSDGVPRFLGAPENGFCIPLKILGQPNLRAWEFYLKELKYFNEPSNTSRDLPGNAGGGLTGRKFYRHQPRTNQSDISAKGKGIIQSAQATVGRFICQPGTRFRFTIRFARLRSWEVGALLAVLEPQHLDPVGKPDDYAHKLGLGRPLGMGSVRIAWRAWRVRRENSIAFLEDYARDSLLEEALRSLLVRLQLNSDQVRSWLSAHRIVQGQRLAYRRVIFNSGVRGRGVRRRSRR